MRPFPPPRRCSDSPNAPPGSRRKVADLKKSTLIRRLKRPFIIIGALPLVPPVEVALVGSINPPRTRPMLLHPVASSVSGARRSPLRYQWADLRNISPPFLKHVWISEDQRFLQHDGFDWREIDIAIERSERRGTPVRGASTITMQCARSIFLWQGRSWIRKGMESYYTLWMEALLPKRRILDLYANVSSSGMAFTALKPPRRITSASARTISPATSPHCWPPCCRI